MGRILLTLSLVAFLAIPMLNGRLDPLKYEGGRSRDEQARIARNSSSIANILGEVRTSMSDIMYIKTERYLHSGIGLETHIDKALSISGATKSIDTHQEALGEKAHQHEGEKTETLIPDREKDFRGFVGALQRNVKPFAGPNSGHEHSDGRELLPWFRLMTLSDPHYIRGYTVGAWWLMRRNYEESVAFIEEGVANNPNAFQIHLMHGHVLFEKARTLAGESFLEPPPEAEWWIFEAHKSFVRAAELAATSRPSLEEREKPGTKWTHYMEDDAHSAVNMALLIEHKYGNEDFVADMIDRLQSAFPDNRSIRKLRKE